jgi:hypothetical protein
MRWFQSRLERRLRDLLKDWRRKSLELQEREHNAAEKAIYHLAIQMRSRNGRLEDCIAELEDILEGTK